MKRCLFHVLLLLGYSRPLIERSDLQRRVHILENKTVDSSHNDASHLQLPNVIEDQF